MSKGGRTQVATSEWEPGTAGASEAQSPPILPGTQVGEFLIGVKIGSGGFGSVYDATHAVIGKRAAVKVLDLEFVRSAQTMARFVAEARAVNKIQHPNIVDIFGFGELPDGRPYCVMELLEGMPLSRYLNARRCLSVPELLTILRPVVSALNAAHDQGVVHRDLKPENIFLCFRDGKMSTVKLLDFGIAKLIGDEWAGGPRTKTGSPIGTPAYMSPEQCTSGDVGPATDVYALGVLCHTALTGEPLFDGASLVEILSKHITVEAARVSSRNQKVPSSLDAPIQAMLAKTPGERPASAKEAFAQMVMAAREAGIDPDVVHVISDVIVAQKSHERLSARAQNAQSVRNGRIAVVGVALAATVVGMVAFGVLRGTKAPASQDPTAAVTPEKTHRLGVVSSAASPQSSPSASQTKKAAVAVVTINVVPKEAVVRQYAPGGSIFLAPAGKSFEVPQASEPVKLILFADGFAQMELLVVPDRSQTLGPFTLKKETSKVPVTKRGGVPIVPSAVGTPGIPAEPSVIVEEPREGK